jgi:hypothetical protein
MLGRRTGASVAVHRRNTLHEKGLIVLIEEPPLAGESLPNAEKACASSQGIRA